MKGEPEFDSLRFVDLGFCLDLNFSACVLNCEYGLFSLDIDFTAKANFDWCDVLTVSGVFAQKSCGKREKSKERV